MSKYPPPTAPYIAARYRGGLQIPRALVLHGTVTSDNPGTARNIANWWKGSTSPKTSCHYVVDPKETIQCVGDFTVAFHCGSNQDTIGIELCDEQTGPASRWNDADSKAIIARAARLAAELCLAYDIDPRRPSVASLKSKGKHGIYGHNDSRLAYGNTSHTDPRDFPWDKFIAQVNAEIKSIKGQSGPLDPTRKDWSDMATKEDIKAALREVLNEDLVIVPSTESPAVLTKAERSILYAIHRIWITQRADYQAQLDDLSKSD